MKAPYHIVTEVLKKSPKASKVCGVEGEAAESDDPRLLRLLNPDVDPRLESGEWSMADDPKLLNSASEVKLCSNVDPKLVESGE